MHKKLIAACMVPAAFAVFAIGPSTASATNNPTLTHPTGTISSVGTKITATSVGSTVIWNTPKNTKLLECTTATMTGELTKNASGNVESKMTSAVFGGTGAKVDIAPECTGFDKSSVTAKVSAAAPWCIRSTTTMVTGEIQISAGNCPGGGNIIFLLVTTTFGNCEYESTGVIKGTLTTDTADSNFSDAIIHVGQPTHEGTGAQGFKRIAGGVFCPSSGLLEMSFTLETDTAAANDPIWIS